MFHGQTVFSSDLSSDTVGPRLSVCYFNVKGVQINAFVQITELSDNIYIYIYIHTQCFNIYQSVSWAANSITRANVFVSTLLSLTTLKIIQVFHLLLGFTENHIFWIIKFKIAFR